MSVAIANALPICVPDTLGRVGFALGRKLLRSLTTVTNLGKAADFHSQRRFWRDSEAFIDLASGFFGARVRRSGWAKRFCFRYNSKTQFHRTRP